MKLYGSLSDNVDAAIASAKRHRGRSVHPETIQFWNDVLGLAKLHIATFLASEATTVARLAEELESELHARRRSSTDNLQETVARRDRKNRGVKP
jgi:hypothetical protein